MAELPAHAGARLEQAAAQPELAAEQPELVPELPAGPERPVARLERPAELRLTEQNWRQSSRHGRAERHPHWVVAEPEPTELAELAELTELIEFAELAELAELIGERTAGLRQEAAVLPFPMAGPLQAPTPEGLTPTKPELEMGLPECPERR